MKKNTGSRKQQDSLNSMGRTSQEPAQQRGILIQNTMQGIYKNMKIEDEDLDLVQDSYRDHLKSTVNFPSARDSKSINHSGENFVSVPQL
jgi:hypothetical protein